MPGFQLIRIVAPSTASATCLLADLVPLARVRSISHTSDGCELLLVTKGDVLSKVADVVVDWLGLCSIHSAELWADGRVFEFSVTEGGMVSAAEKGERSLLQLAEAKAPAEPSAA
jgi:hypothetical protein